MKRLCYLYFLLLINGSILFAQGVPDENENSSIFDETEMHSEMNSYQQTQFGQEYSGVSSSQKQDPRQTNGAPILPSPPDVPINDAAPFLFAVGIIFAVKKLLSCRASYGGRSICPGASR